MSDDTAIEWTDHTFNPWWGCVNVSPGCDHCYAEMFAKRVGQDVWGKTAGRRFFGDKHWNEPKRWTGRVFCASMADVFEPNPVLVAERERLQIRVNAAEERALLAEAERDTYKEALRECRVHATSGYGEQKMNCYIHIDQIAQAALSAHQEGESRG